MASVHSLAAIMNFPAVLTAIVENRKNYLVLCILKRVVIENELPDAFSWRITHETMFALLNGASSPVFVIFVLFTGGRTVLFVGHYRLLFGSDSSFHSCTIADFL
jgi:hypothetical protein